MEKRAAIPAALMSSIALHAILLVALVAFFELRQNDEGKSIPQYSVLMEKRRSKPVFSASKGAIAKAVSRRTSGNAEHDLDGQVRVEHASYEMVLASRIEKHRYYPRLALKLGQEGQPVIKIILDKSGRLVTVSIEKSSGQLSLDEAALDIVTKAQPFPAPPDVYLKLLEKRGDNRLIFRAPISFDISQARL